MGETFLLDGFLDRMLERCGCYVVYSVFIDQIVFGVKEGFFGNVKYRSLNYDVLNLVLQCGVWFRVNVFVSKYVGKIGFIILVIMFISLRAQ